jgi:menaquinone-9 beta-reductase
MAKFDVAIIGAGPSGSATAIALARRGYAVALIDKERFPREKLCGDFVNPTNWPILDTLGVTQEILSREHQRVTAFRITTFSGAEAGAPLPAKNGHTAIGLGLRRAFLDHILLRKAEEENATVLPGSTIRELKRNSQGWLFQVDRLDGLEELRAKVLIGADGRNSWVAHHLGLSGAAATQGRSVGFQLRLRVPSGVDGRVEIHLFPGGYAGLIGLGGDAVNLCWAVDKRKLSHHRSVEFLLESCLPQNPHLKKILRRSAREGEVRSTYPVYFPPRRSFDNGVLLVGDAARVNEPVTGEGIYFALKSGQLAAETIDRALRRGDVSAAQLGAYEQECRRAFRLRRGLNTLIRILIYRPALLEPLIRLSATKRRLLESMIRAICLPEPAP